MFIQLPRYDLINGLLLLIRRLIFTILGPAPRFKAYSLKTAAELVKNAGLKLESLVAYNKGLDIHLTLINCKGDK